MVVVKIGGALLARTETFNTLLAEIAAASAETPILVIPGGGPFADAVRAVDRQLGLTDDAAHWMAVLAMDQYAHAIASRLPGGKVVSRPGEIDLVLEDGGIPVLAPYEWVREADPLPHSWDITSDSISVWVANEVGAERLVLVKPAGASGSSVVDPSFDDLVPAHIRTEIVTADRIGGLRAALSADEL
jgi:5-(aminomethyl)-3-furanmethanol phosphate kinase